MTETILCKRDLQFNEPPNRSHTIFNHSVVLVSFTSSIMRERGREREHERERERRREVEREGGEGGRTGEGVGGGRASMSE